jgi:hypothetical protein
VFAFGKTGGFNYFLGRPNATSTTHGFALSGHAESVRAEIAANPAILLIDLPFHDREAWPKNRITNWMSVPQPTFYSTVDRPIFDALMTGCEIVGEWPSDTDTPRYRIFDCS